MHQAQYKEAVQGDWLDKDRIKEWNLTPLEDELIKSTKITYMVGKIAGLHLLFFRLMYKEH